ncbi:hypothetical protein NDU88_000086, partial [Pleurodeles waltl]
VTVPLHRHTPGLHRSQYHSSGTQVHPRSSQITVPHHRSQYNSTQTDASRVFTGHSTTPQA